MESPYRTLPLDERTNDVGLLRFWAAIAAIVGAIWLGLSRPPWTAWIAVAAAAFVALFWFRRWARARAASLDPSKSYLALDADGFELAHEGATERVAWQSVRTLEADEERVAVRVERAGGVLYVEPTFGGLGLYELEAAMRAAREASPLPPE